MVRLARRLRPVLDHVAALTGLLQRYERRMRDGVVALTYHRVLPDATCEEYPLESLAMPLSAFREQVRWVAGHCDVLPLNEAIGAMGQTDRWHRPRVCFTFDDGYVDNYRLAASVLEEHGLRGTFFVTVEPVISRQLLWFDVAALAWRRLSARGGEAGQPPGPHTAKLSLPDWMQMLKQCPPADRQRLVEVFGEWVGDQEQEPLYRMMTQQEVVELQRRGHEIGSHTWSHPLLSQLGDKDLALELARSRRVLEEWLDEEVTGFCYPNGDQDDRVVRAVAEAGYRYACTTLDGINEAGCDLLRLRRLNMTPTRVTRLSGEHDELAFRSEICLLHRAWRS